jgi:anti-sigma factor RsiW
MCNQRERLIGYVYNEGDPSDLAEVQRHVDECAECRAEIAGLRSVRQDLLAWDVPERESVWRPFVAAPVTPWWRQVPAWAMAAAAGVMLLIGATGGVVAQALVPDQSIARDSQNVAAPAGPVLTSADLSAAEQRLLARLEQSMSSVGARVQQVSNRSQSMQALEGDHSDLTKELISLREQNQAQLDLIGRIYKGMVAAKTSNENLEQKLRDLRDLVNAQILSK